MQAKNLLIFIAVCLLILFGWPYLERTLWPPPPPKEKSKNELAKKEPAKKEKPKKVEKPPEKKPEKKPKKEEKPAAPEKPAEVVTLGSQVKDSEYHLGVRLTTLGGGVDGVTLNKFEGANSDGRPTGERERLIPPEAHHPSFLLYHFATPDPKDKRPVDTLGRMAWEIVPGKDGKPIVTDKDGVQRVTFKAAVPRLKDVTIFKTYELAPRTYHIGLTVEVKDGRKAGARDKAAREIRLQLAGPHGLPIEGKWYTSLFRNALIGRVDKNGSLWRSVEDSRRISVREGGDRVPEGNLDANEAIQYGGVQIQYFASLIVVDNTGPRKDFPPRILEWARPTLEFTEMRGKIKALSHGARTLVLVDEKGNETAFAFPAEQKAGGKKEDSKQSPESEAGDHIAFDELRGGQVVYVGYWLGRTRTVGDKPHVAAQYARTTEHPHNPALDDISVRVNTETIKLGPGESRSEKFLLYNGPAKVRLLSQFTGIEAVPVELVNRYEYDLHLSTITDYHSDNRVALWFSKIGWTALLIACTNLMHWLLGWLHWILPVYGLNIILLTVLVRGLMFPISRKQAYLSLRMQELAPEMKKVQEKYKNDPQAKTQAMMELYRKHGVNPLGGCLPLLLQMPIFLGLYYALQESIFFRLASFLWIENLAAPDMLFRWGNNVPIVSGLLGPYLNILPVFAVALMIVQQKMMTPPPTDENQAFQQKLMKYMMVFIGFMFYKVAAGLCLYFIASSLWGVAERKMLPKRKPLGATAQTAGGGPPSGPGPRPGPSRPGPRRGPGGKRGPQPKKNEDGAFQRVKDWWADVLKQAKKK